MIDLSEVWRSKAPRGFGKKRLSADHSLNLFAAFDESGMPELILESDCNVFSEVTPKSFKNISILSEGREGHYQLRLLLRSPDLKDLFVAICSELVNATEDIKDPQKASEVFISRLNRWSDLLSSGGYASLSEELVRGLIGELFFIRWLLSLEVIPKGQIILGWRGADRDSRDFGFDVFDFEIKTSLTTSSARIKISSLEQLETSAEEFYLIRYILTPDPDGHCISGLLSEIKNYLADAPGLRLDFMTKVYQAGFIPEIHEEKTCYSVLAKESFMVTDEFPKITPSVVPEGIRNCVYEIDRTSIERFIVEVEKVKERLCGSY